MLAKWRTFAVCFLLIISPASSEDYNDTGGGGSNDADDSSVEDFEFVANPNADAMERDLQKKIILYQNRRSQADIEKAKKIKSMLDAYRFSNGIVVDQPTVVSSPARSNYDNDQYSRSSDLSQQANENDLRLLASKRERLAKFLERVRNQRRQTQPSYQTIAYTTRPTQQTTVRTIMNPVPSTKRRSIRDNSCKFEFAINKQDPSQLCEDVVNKVPGKVVDLEQQMRITTKMIADMQVEQQHNTKQLFNELRTVDADAQRIRRDTELQSTKIAQLERKVANTNDQAIEQSIQRYSRVLRSVESKEKELDRKIRETDAILREVKTLKGMMENVDSKIDRILTKDMAAAPTRIGNYRPSGYLDRRPTAPVVPRPQVQLPPAVPSSRLTAKDCSYYQAYDMSSIKDGIYKLDGLVNPVTKRPMSSALNVYCHFDDNGMGWTVIQRRNTGVENFNRKWADYKRGFGDLKKEFWLGLQSIYTLTADPTKNFWLEIIMEDLDGRIYKARYQRFALYDERRYYAIKNAVFTAGNAGNSLYFNINNGFSTPDSDHDKSAKYNCAQYLKSGWWFSNCGNSNLNGHYYTTGHYKGMSDGIFWNSARGRFYSFRTTEMRIRPMTDKEQRDMGGDPEGPSYPSVYR